MSDHAPEVQLAMDLGFLDQYRSDSAFSDLPEWMKWLCIKLINAGWRKQ